MRRYLSGLRARAATNVGSHAMLNVLLISLALVIIAFIISWMIT
jgi:hypothetical protein